MLQQRTLKSLTKAVGVGLHSGQRVELTLRPAQPDTGIVFRRVDLPQPVDIPISALAVTDTRLASTISTGGAKVHTVEHLMSACAGLGNRQPVRGHHRRRGAHPGRFVGLVCIPAAKRGHRAAKSAQAFHPRDPARRGARRRWRHLKWARLVPYHGYKLSFEIDFDHRVVNSTGQSVEFDLGSGSYTRDIARAAPLALPRTWR